MPPFPFRESDASLARKARQGPTSEERSRAFEALISRWQKKAWAIARANGVRESAMEDVVQESFLAAFGGLDRLRAPESFGPWLLGIVRNISRKELRRGDRAGVGPVPEEAAPGKAPDPLEMEELRGLLWRKVDELPAIIREAVFLYYHEGESVGEVARALNVSRSAVKSRLQKGRDLLREDLWRELRQHLRDMLPGARVWKQKSRRLALLAAAAGPALRPAPAEAAAPLAPAPAAPGSSSWFTRGGLFLAIAKPVAIIIVAAALLGGGTAIVLRQVSGGARSQEAPAGPTLAVSIPRPPVAPVPETQVSREGRNNEAPAGIEALPGAVYRLRDLRTDEPIDARQARLEVEPSDGVTVEAGEELLTVAVPEGLDAITLRVFVPGYLPGEFDLDGLSSPRGGREPVTIPLDPGITISGTVVERESGEPIADARVSAFVLSGLMIAPDAKPFAADHSDLEGIFVIRGSGPAVRVLLRVEAPGHALLERQVTNPTAEDVESLVLDLERGYEVLGKIVVEDLSLELPVEPVNVVLNGQDLQGRHFGRTQQTSPSNGLHFQFANLPEGEYSLGAGPQEERFSQSNGTGPFRLGGAERVIEKDIVVTHGETLRGRLLKSDGSPWGGASVSTGGGKSCTGHDGYFEISRLPPVREPVMVVLLPGDAHFRLFPVFRNPDTYVVDPEPELCQLKVIGPDGADISQREFELSWPDQEGRWGAMWFIPAERGLLVRDPKTRLLWDDERRCAPKEIEVGKDGANDLTVELEEGAVLRGTLVTASGKPVVNGKVTATMDGGPGWRDDARTDATGAFELRGLPKDPARLRWKVSEAGDLDLRDEPRIESYERPLKLVLSEKPAGSGAAAAVDPGGR